MKNYKKIPNFPKELRDKILNYTDNKKHQSFLKLLESPSMFKILMGAKNVSKSFGCMIETIYRIINEPNYNAIWARNLSKDITRTILPNFKKALNFLKIQHNLDYEPFFKIYNNGAYFVPTGQGIYFANFELVDSFSGITLPKNDFYFGDLVCDEIQQNPDDFTDKKFDYERQKTNMEIIYQSTILRDSNPNNSQRRVIFTFNVYDKEHWVINDYVKHILPFNEINRKKLIDQNYLYEHNENCDIMRISRFYVPRNTISKFQLDYYKNLKINNPKIYEITVAGESFDFESQKFIFPFKKFLNDENIKSLIYDKKINKDDFIMIIDGFDPGLKDKNGFCRIGLNKNFEIIVIYCNEIDSKYFSNFKRLSTCEYILATIINLNNYIGLEHSILAVDSKDDVILEILLKNIIENKLNISVIKAIKNKNKNFKIDFNISNRINFLTDCFQKQIIKFTPQAKKIIDYLAKIAVTNEYNRDEKINYDIYDLINAFEYACSIIYHLVIINNVEVFNE